MRDILRLGVIFLSCDLLIACDNGNPNNRDDTLGQETRTLASAAQPAADNNPQTIST